MNFDLDSFECNLVEDLDKEKQVRGVQHCWNIQNDHDVNQNNLCKINGLVQGKTYRIFVIANYTTLHGNQPSDIQTTSAIVRYTTMGPPLPPSIYILSVNENEVCHFINHLSYFNMDIICAFEWKSKFLQIRNCLLLLF